MYSNSTEQKALAKRIFLEDLAECEKFPKYFQIEATDRCNARCRMCTKSITKNEHISTMSRALFDKLADELKEYADWIEMISIYWMGESLLDQDLEYKIKRLKEIGIKRVSLSTNGALLSRERCESVLEAGLDDLRFSIDSLRKDVYESIRKGLSFEKVVDNVKQAIKLRNALRPETQIRIHMVDLKENHDEIDEYKRFWKKYLAPGDMIQIIFQHTKWDTQNELSRYSTMVPCISLFSTMVINAEGRVALCCLDSELEEELGDVSKQTIKEVWNSEKLREIRKLHLENERNTVTACVGCNMWLDFRYEDDFRICIE